MQTGTLAHPKSAPGSGPIDLCARPILDRARPADAGLPAVQSCLVTADGLCLEPDPATSARRARHAAPQGAGPGAAVGCVPGNGLAGVLVDANAGMTLCGLCAGACGHQAQAESNGCESAGSSCVANHFVWFPSKVRAGSVRQLLETILSNGNEPVWNAIVIPGSLKKTN